MLRLLGVLFSALNNIKTELVKTNGTQKDKSDMAPRVTLTTVTRSDETTENWSVYDSLMNFGVYGSAYEVTTPTITYANMLSNISKTAKVD